MSEKPTNPEAQKEQVFKSWVKSIQIRGRTMYCYDDEIMPSGAGDVYDLYTDRKIHKGINNPEAQKAAEDFRNITGYEAEEFLQYLWRLNNE